VRWVTFLLVVLVAGSMATGAEAAKKHSKSPGYYGSVEASGVWQQTYNCSEPTYKSSWQLEATYAKTTLDVFGQLDMSQGGASGRIDYTWDDCLGNVKTGNCSVGLDSYVLPAFFDKVKGGIRVDFQLSLTANGCSDPYANVYPYGVGFESFNRTTREPQGFIPSKKIGKKVIVVPISGNDSGTAAGRSFSGQMSGTLRLTRKKQLQALPN
jgi:hypothetical protein